MIFKLDIDALKKSVFKNYFTIFTNAKAFLEKSDVRSYKAILRKMFRDKSLCLKVAYEGFIEYCIEGYISKSFKQRFKTEFENSQQFFQIKTMKNAKLCEIL